MLGCDGVDGQHWSGIRAFDRVVFLGERTIPPGHGWNGAWFRVGYALDWIEERDMGEKQEVSSGN